MRRGFDRLRERVLPKPRRVCPRKGRRETMRRGFDRLREREWPPLPNVSVGRWRDPFRDLADHERGFDTHRADDLRTVVRKRIREAST